MSLNPDKPGFRPVQVPTFRYDQKRASDAYRAYQAIWHTEAANPDLSDNPAWTILREDAFENFALAFGSLPE